MEKVYKHKDVEEKIYQNWEEKGYFKADPSSPKKPYSLLMPPPNLTGELHLGHAMQHSIMDAIARFKRMQGRDVLLLPGVDHASIQFEDALNKILAKEGLSKQKLGKEKWLQRAWQLKEEIYQSFHKDWTVFGISADWSREVFTMDEIRNRAVFEQFRKYYEDGLVYKGAYIVQWCSKCGTAIEDVEMEYEERKDKLYYLKYGPFVLATVRPETKFGDTAMAVHPDDNRYKKYIGQEFEIETLTGKRKMRVIADEAVDPKFGTGVIKVTPGHDFNDYEIGQRHNLPIINVINKEGRLTEVAGKYAGMKTYEARKAMLPELKEKGLLVKEEDYLHTVPVCERCKTTVEPIISEEWFVKMKPLAQKALKHLDEINFIPKNYRKIIADWLKGIHDWCISRNLWWGHKMPIWYCDTKDTGGRKLGFAKNVISQVLNGKVVTYRLTDHHFKIGDRVAFEDSASGKVFGFATITNVKRTSVGELPLDDPRHGATYNKREELIDAFKKHYPKLKVTNKTEAFIYEYEFASRNETNEYCGLISLSDQELKSCPKCGCQNIKQDEHILDTWFSSGLWPLSTLEYPSFSKETQKYFPWDFEITAPEIKYLWIARMIMISLYLADQVPFKNMFFHGTLRDLQGRKFSKSLGNGIDPNDLREAWGTDAVRMALYSYSAPGRDGRTSRQLMDERCRNFRNFCTKIRNIYKFIYELKPDDTQVTSHKLQVTSQDDKLIKEQLNKTVKEVTKNLEGFKLHLATEALYDFIWHQFADVYLEKSKKRREEVQPVLEYVFESCLKMLHPFMPFVTEELYQKLPDHKELMMTENWPITSLNFKL